MNESSPIRQLILLGAIVSCALGHSWIACTDYTKKNDGVYNANRCRGFPRAARFRIPRSKLFGVDAGFAITPKEDKPCQAPRNDKTQYNRRHPMAVYYPGQQVVIAHPMKRHGADAKCTNIWIPDHGSFIYRGERNTTTDPVLSDFKKNFVFDLGRSPVGSNNTRSSSYPKPGFQNAPALCDHSKAPMDRALGTYSFNVPKDIAPGRYTFIWLWAFNRPNELYSTCFEVDVLKNLQERNRRLKNNGYRDLSEPCGGVTSNPKVRGNCNQPRVKPTKRKLPSTSRIQQPTVKPKQKKANPSKMKKWCKCPCRG